MARTPYAGRHYLGIHILLAVHGDNIGDQRNAVPANIVEAADKGTHHRAPRIGSKQGLVQREDQGLVDSDAVFGEHADGFEAFLSAGDLDPGVGNPLGDVSALSDHPGSISAHHLHRNGPVHNVCNLLDGGPIAGRSADSFLGSQRRVGGNSRNDAQFGSLPNFVNVGGIQKQFQSLILQWMSKQAG